MADLAGIRFERLAWGAFGIAVTAVVAFVVYAFLGGILIGLFLYYATRPVRDRLATRMDHPDVAATASLLVVGVPLFLILGYAGAVGLSELDQFLRTFELAQYRPLIEPYVDISRATEPRALLSFVRENAGRLLPLLGDLFLWAGRLFVGVVVAFYLLRSEGEVASWFRGSVGADHDAVRFFEGVDEALETIYVGNLLTVAITGLIAAATFYAFDLLTPGSPTIQFPFLLGLLVGVFTMFPVVGMKVIWIPYAAFLFLRSLLWNQLPLWVPAAFVVVTVTIVDFLPDIFVRSYVSKGDINMGLMLLAYTLGVIVFGWYGLFLGPLVLVVFLHFAERIFPNLIDAGSIRLVNE